MGWDRTLEYRFVAGQEAEGHPLDVLVTQVLAEREKGEGRKGVRQKATRERGGAVEDGREGSIGETEGVKNHRRINRGTYTLIPSLGYLSLGCLPFLAVALARRARAKVTYRRRAEGTQKSDAQPSSASEGQGQ